MTKKPTLEYARRGTVRKRTVRPEWGVGAWCSLVLALALLFALLLFVRQLSTGFNGY
jgi:hypothetical protein